MKYAHGYFASGQQHFLGIYVSTFSECVHDRIKLTQAVILEVKGYLRVTLGLGQQRKTCHLQEAANFAFCVTSVL